MIWLMITGMFWLFVVCLELMIAIFYGIQIAVDPLLGLIPPASAGFINLTFFYQGFSLFSFLPTWLRVLLFSYIAFAVISVLPTVLAISYFSYKYPPNYD
ncbi:MAG: hypothetical protein M1161_00160 [Candidatus Thermoplasmatota archaeon]|jgi:hypothetical protein|nr:hypothetical protein [Candidatus Thermoplasmatota archaeon]